MRAVSRSLVIILLAIIVFVIGGLVWIFLGGYVELQSECLTIVDYKDFTLVVRNCGKTYIPDFQISINNEPVQTEETDRSLRPEETKILTLLELPRSGIQQIVLTTTRNEYSVGYPVPVAWNFKNLNGVTNVLLCPPPNDLKRCITGDVELNDGSGQQYVSKPVDVKIDTLEVQRVTTDTSGHFIHQTDLDFQALLPNNFWPVGVPYHRPAEDTILDPPAHIEYQFLNNNQPEPPYDTLEPYVILKDRSTVIGKKDIRPLSLSPTHISYSFDYHLDTFQLPDRPGEDVWFGTAFENVENFPPFVSNPALVSLNCPDTADVTCYEGLFSFVAGSAAPYVNNPLSGMTFSYNPTLPNQNAVFDFITIPTPSSNPAAISLGLEILKNIPGEGLRVIFSQSYHPIHFIQQQPDVFDDLSFSINDMDQELHRRFPSEPVEGEYIAKIDISHPNSSVILGQSFSRFGIDDTSSPTHPSSPLSPLPSAPLSGFPSQIITPEIPYGQLGYPGQWVFILHPKKTIYWKFSSIQPGTTYDFGFDTTFSRDPTNDLTIREGLDHLYYVKPNGEIIQFFTPSNGGIPKNSDTKYSMVLKVPSQATNFYAYTIGIPLTSGSDNFMIKTWLLNTGITPIVETTVFSKRGETTGSSADLLPNAGISSSQLTESLAFNLHPNLGENQWKQWYKIRMHGYSMSFAFFVQDFNTPLGTCTGPPTPSQPNPPCDYYVDHGSSNYQDWRRCGLYEFCELTPPLSQGETFKARITLSNSLQYPAPGTYLPADAQIILWNWYITQTHLWSNQDPHTGRLFTAQPEPYLPARRRLTIT